jgi:hypothetical protein
MRSFTKSSTWSRRYRGLVALTAWGACAVFVAPGRAVAQTAPPTSAYPEAPAGETPPLPPSPPPPPAPESPAAPPAAPPSAPAAEPPPPPVLTPPAAEAAPAPETQSSEPLAGWSDGTAFLRSPDNQFFLFPNGRLQNDGLFYKSDNHTPFNTFTIRRARLELAGWIGPWVYFHLAGDFAAGPPAAAAPVAPTNLNTTDDFIGIAPFKTLAILQFGQYDAPFTLENRTSDKYFDFMERSVTVRAFGIPSNKEIGGMLTGYNDERNYLYSVGVFNGDGQNFKNVDGFFDVMGRAWIAPFSFTGPEALHDAEVGGSFWTGNRSNALPAATQTTQAGFTFWNPSWTWTQGTTKTPMQLRQQGRLNEFAIEVNVPVEHKYGIRSEYVWKRQPLSAENVTTATSSVILGGVNLNGFSIYGEAWFWALGDDRIIGDQQGIQPYTRWKKFGVKPPQDGVMLAFRFEYLSEETTEEADAAALMLGNPEIGSTKVTVYEFGVNYWHSKRFRATFNYIFNHFAGTAKFITSLPSSDEQEFTFRLAIAL